MSFQEINLYQSQEQPGINKNIQIFVVTVSNINKLIKKVGTIEDSYELRQTIEKLINNNTNLAKEITECLQVIHKNTSGNRKVEMKKINCDFLTELSKFQFDIKSYCDKKIKINIQNIQNNQNDQNIENIQQPITFSVNSSFPDQEQHFECGVSSQLIEERHAEIREIEQKMTILNEIFKDLDQLTAEQSPHIDNIEVYLSNSEQYTTDSLLEVSKSDQKQTYSRKSICCLMLLIIAIIIIVIFGFLIAMKSVN